MLAIAAIKKLRTTPGPAIVFATMPATRYMPVPQHDPTPNDVKSNVVKHFYGPWTCVSDDSSTAIPQTEHGILEMCVPEKK